MSWVEISVVVYENFIEYCSEVMTAQGALSITCVDLEQEDDIFDDDKAVKAFRAPTLIKALFDANDDTVAIIDRIKSADEYFDSLHYQVKKIEDQDWVRQNQQQFDPVLIDQTLWVCPQGRTVDVAQLQIQLDPGCAFGTGSHPTTYLCLSWLVQNSVKGQVIIDYGCGSGILSLGALALGAKQVYSIDNQLQAIEATSHNANLNQLSMGEKIIVILDEDMPSIKVPCILANMLAKPLCQLVERFNSLLQTNGQLVLSGLQQSDIGEIRDYYRPYFKEIELVYREEWARMVWVKTKEN